MEEMKIEENTDNLDKIEENKSSWGGKREGSGRKPGSSNKVSKQVKDNVLEVFDNIGGIEHMTNWAREYPTEFYKFYVKLMPTQSEITGADGADLPIGITVEYVRPSKD